MRSEEIGLTPLGKLALSIVIIVLIYLAIINIFPEFKYNIFFFSTENKDAQKSSYTASTNQIDNQTNQQLDKSSFKSKISVEAPDLKGITTVQEYKYVPKEKLPPVKGVSNYEWDNKNKTVNFAINIWIGWLPVIMANNGFRPNNDSIFYKKYGFKVNLQLIDDPIAARDAFAAGKIHVLWGTLDMMVLFAQELMKDSRTSPRIVQLIDWSNGGDGIVVRGNIKSVKDLKGKTIVYAQNSPSQYFINNLLLSAGIKPSDVKHKYTTTAFEAAAAFVADTSIDACVSWAPDIYNIPERVPKTRLLTTTADANRLIADVYAVRADFARDNPDIVKGLVAGIFEGMRMLNNSANKSKALQLMADGFGVSVDDIKNMLNDAYITSFGENKEFFLNKNNPTNFERTWNNITTVYRELGLIGTPVRFDEVMDFSIIQELDQTGEFKDLDYVQKTTFKPVTYKKLAVEAPVITQTIRINFYPNSANLYEPERDEFGRPVPNTLYDPTVDISLEKVARLAGQYERAIIAIVGHTDASMKGKVPIQAVKELSEARAKAVKEALIQKYKFSPEKIVTIGKGWDEPADPLDPNNHTLNRRVEIQVYSPEQNQ